MKCILVVFTFIAFAGSLLGLNVQAQMGQEPGKMEKLSDKVADPVTDKVMKASEAPASLTLYFASETAKEVFLKNPSKFLTTRCPVSGEEVNKLNALFSDHNGKAYYFCFSDCQPKFEQAPTKYIGKKTRQLGKPGPSFMPMRARTVTDPVCGMKISSGGTLISEYRGETYHFCSTRCRESFTKAPGTYIKE
ncbi:MAG: YHS domain-containing protein [bacterium]